MGELAKVASSSPSPLGVGREATPLPLAQVRSAFSLMGAIGAQQKLPPVVAYPSIEPCRPRIFDGLRKLARETGLSFLDVSRPSAVREGANCPIYRADPHPNVRANELFADALCDFLNVLGDGRARTRSEGHSE